MVEEREGPGEDVVCKGPEAVWWDGQCDEAAAQDAGQAIKCADLKLPESVWAGQTGVHSPFVP